MLSLSMITLLALGSCLRFGCIRFNRTFLMDVMIGISHQSHCVNVKIIFKICQEKVNKKWLLFGVLVSSLFKPLKQTKSKPFNFAIKTPNFLVFLEIRIFLIFYYSILPILSFVNPDLFLDILLFIFEQ